MRRSTVNDFGPARVFTSVASGRALALVVYDFCPNSF